MANGAIRRSGRTSGVTGLARSSISPGRLVIPGLIDLHAHVMAGLGDFCVEPDDIGVEVGVPVVVDGGTSGVATFDICRRAIIDHPMVRTRVLAFIDPNQLYLATGDFICHKLEIANDLRNLDEAALGACLERNADVIVGLKVRACHIGDPEHSPFLEAAQRARAPGRSWCTWGGSRTPRRSHPRRCCDACAPATSSPTPSAAQAAWSAPTASPSRSSRDAIERGVRARHGPLGDGLPVRARPAG